MTKNITLNGRQAATDSLTIADLLRELDAPDKGVAVARNEAVVRRADWPQTPLQDGDKIEIIRAVQGG